MERVGKIETLNESRANVLKHHINIYVHRARTTGLHVSISQARRRQFHIPGITLSWRTNNTFHKRATESAPDHGREMYAIELPPFCSGTGAWPPSDYHDARRPNAPTRQIRSPAYTTLLTLKQAEVSRVRSLDIAVPRGQHQLLHTATTTVIVFYIPSPAKFDTTWYSTSHQSNGARYAKVVGPQPCQGGQTPQHHEDQDLPLLLL